MKSQGKLYRIALPAALTAGLLLCLLAGGICFAKYLRQQIFVERTAQLNEITSQVRVNLTNALDAHWNYLTTAVNLLEKQRLTGEADAVNTIRELDQLLETDRYSSLLMLLDSQGNCYDARGNHGVWSDLDQISGGGTQYTFISDSYAFEGSYWAFVQKLEQPLPAGNSGLSFTHVVLLKDVYTLTNYYDSTAYGSQNETYILKSNGTRMHDSLSDSQTIQAYNVLKVLEGMEGQSIPDIRAAIAETDTISTNFFQNGTEYYYCLTSLAKYDTLLLFLIPADFVASGTVDMVGAVIQTLLLLAVVLLAMLNIAVIFFAQQQADRKSVV